jgi:hypothetical protein
MRRFANEKTGWPRQCAVAGPLSSFSPRRGLSGAAMRQPDGASPATGEASRRRRWPTRPTSESTTIADIRDDGRPYRMGPERGGREHAIEDDIGVDTYEPTAASRLDSCPEPGIEA